MSYMFIHDGLVHRRFPVGPIAEVPYLKRVAIAHKLHHSEKYDGVPWGLFLGPQVCCGPLYDIFRCTASINAAKAFDPSCSLTAHLLHQNCSDLDICCCILGHFLCSSDNVVHGLQLTAV